MHNKRKRLKDLEQRAQPARTEIDVVDVRDLAPAEASACLAVKRAELVRQAAPAALIILKYKEANCHAQP